MKIHMKIGLFLSLVILASSLLVHFTSLNFTSDDSLSESEIKEAELAVRETQDSLKRKRLSVTVDTARSGKKYQLRDLEEKKVEICKDSLNEFRRLGDFFDPNSSVFENKRKLSRKLNYITNEFLISNDKYKAYIELFSYSSLSRSLSLKKSDFLKISESLSGCSEASNIGIALSSTLEAIKIKQWRNIKVLIDPFLLLAKSEAEFVSWNAFSKASGIVLPILMALGPDSSELQEFRRFRADILQGIQNESELIKRSLNYDDAKGIVEAEVAKKKAFQDELRRLIILVQDLQY